MSSTTNHLVAQVILVIVWMALVSTAYDVRVNSQGPVCGTPGSGTPDNYNPPPTSSWPALKYVTVKLDSTYTEDERNLFKAGIEKWNGANNCSGVTFNDFSAQPFPNPDEAVPNDTVYWINTEPGVSYEAWTTWDRDVNNRQGPQR